MYIFETIACLFCIKQIRTKFYLMKTFTITAILSLFICFNSYSQCIKGNCYKGHGTFQWDNGDMYIGSWVNGLPNGQGKFIWENGDNYMGAFDDGKLSGKGTYKWKTGNSYNGIWAENKMNGRGTYYWAQEGASYEGFFQDDKIINIETDDSQDVPEGKD